MKRIAALLLAVAASLAAGGGPETTIVVVNGDSWASLTVASAWCRLRGIPERNIVRLSRLTDWEELPWPAFLAEVLHPLRRQLAARSQLGIDTIALAPDVPCSVGLTSMPGCPDLYPIGPRASSTAVIGLFLWVDPTGPEALLSPLSNRYAAVGQRTRQPIVGHAPAMQALVSQALRDGWDGGHWPEAIASLERVLASGEDPDQRYNLACARARSGDTAGALADLARAVDAGWTNGHHAAQDADLVTLHDLPPWSALLARMRPDPDVPLPLTRSLAMTRREAAWPASTGPVPTMMLPPTSGRGLAVDAAVALLMRCQAADGMPPAGTVWFMQNEDHRAWTRSWQTPAVIAALRRIGLQAQTGSSVVPELSPVAGAQTGAAECPWPTELAISPGAIVDNLTSFGGMLQPWGSQTCCTQMLARGAAGTTGTVEEPMADQRKFPEPSVQLHYARGATVAEALWLATSGPYQTLMLGDPLCAAYARPLPLTATVSERDGQALVRWPVDRRVRTVRIWRDGELQWEGGSTGEARLDARAWPQGRCDVVVTAITDDAIETQSRHPVRLNRGKAPTLTTTTSTISWGGTITVNVGQPCRIRCTGGDLGAADAETPLMVSSTRLGLGANDLQAVIEDANGRATAVSAPLRIDVVPLVFDAIPSGDHPVRLDDLRIGSAAAAIDTWILATEPGLHQFQLCGGAARRATLRIDTQAVPLAGSGWRSAPMQLAAGWHRLQFELSPGDPRVELRFGRHGTGPIGPAATRVADQPAPERR